MLHYIYVTIYSCYTIFMLHYIHVTQTQPQYTVTIPQNKQLQNPPLFVTCNRPPKLKLKKHHYLLKVTGSPKYIDTKEKKTLVKF